MEMETMKMERRPPLSPQSSSSSVSHSRSARSVSQESGGSSSSRKASKKSNSDSPSASGSNSNGHGKSQVDQRLRSVLSHPLALPLLHTLHGKDPEKLDYLSRKSMFYEDDGTESTSFDCIFENTVNDWRKVTKRDELGLTKALAETIEDEHINTNFHCDGEATLWRTAKELTSAGSVKPYGRIDILLTPEEKGNKTETESTPFAIIEVGRHDVEWWKKLDQNIKYLSRMGNDQKDKRLRFGQPLLLAVLTIEGEGEGDELKVRLGVFFCSPKGTSKDDYRMSLLWRSRTNDLTKASKDFGRLLRATSDFSRWREDWRKEEQADVNVRWKYLGPNCCKVEVHQQVLYVA
jgi:hypothetical protein